MNRSHLKILSAAAFVLALTAPGFAQITREPRPGVLRSDEAKKNDSDFDAQYRSRANAAQADAAKDPWGNVRTPPAAQPSTTAKKPAATKNN